MKLDKPNISLILALFFMILTAVMAILEIHTLTIYFGILFVVLLVVGMYFILTQYTKRDIHKQHLCSGYRVFPDGIECKGCDDCKT